MGWYNDRIVPRALDLLLGNEKMGPLRSRAMEGMSGTVVELGFGSGTNVPYYPEGVEKVFAIEPSGGAKQLASKRLAASTVPVEFVGLDGASIPLEDSSVDHALSTWTLCTIPDLATALEEVARVLKPGGRLFFLEHGLSDDPKVSTRQHRLNGLQQRIGGGCHLTRDHRALIEASPLRIEKVANFAITGPKTMSYMYAGTAIRD